MSKASEIVDAVMGVKVEYYENFDVGDDVAIVICSYVKIHMDYGEMGEIEPRDCWPVYVNNEYENVRQRMIKAVEEKLEG